MDRKTAADILSQPALPVVKKERTYRTHTDKLAPYWSEVEDLLKNDSKLKAYVLFEEMLKRHPDSFDRAWQRTFERRVRDWKLEQRIEKDVTFDQIHEPGDVLAFDFTSMNELGIIIANQKFDHMLFHAVLTYSNWEYIDLCFSESFEALAKGIQGCFQAIGGVTRRIRNDSLSAAVNNLSTDRHFTTNFRNLVEHFHVQPHRINVRTPRENGDCESLHGHFKDYVDQRLRIRGSREFESREDWITFLRDCIAEKNLARQSRFLQEQATLAELPTKLFPTYTEQECMVASNSIITVKQNRYSIPSCFVGHRIQVRIFADDIQVWYACKLQFTMPRLIGKNQAYVDFRHVIDSLVRKPNAFANYRFHEHMFPSIEYRKAFDTLNASLGEASATRIYLRLLQVAKQEGLSAVEGFVSGLQVTSEGLSGKSLLASLDSIKTTVPATVVESVHVKVPDLDPYDNLLEHKEVLNEPQHDPGCQLDAGTTAPIGTGFPFETSSSAHDTFDGNEPLGTSSQGELAAPEVPERIDVAGMRITQRQSGSARLEEVRPGTEQDMGPSRLETLTANDPTTHGPIAQRRVPQGSEQPSAVWKARLREDVATEFAWGRSCTGWVQSLHGSVREVGSASALGEEGAAIATDANEAWEIFSIDHRRSWLCAAESGRDGSALHVDSGPLREDEYSVEFEPAVFEVGEYIQRPYDHGCGNRPTGAPQHHPGVECTELSLGTGQQEPRNVKPIWCVINRETFPWGNLTVAKVEF
jgi:transposase